MRVLLLNSKTQNGALAAPRTMAVLLPGAVFGEYRKPILSYSSRIFPDRTYRVRIYIFSAIYMEKAISEKILAVFTSGASIIAVECPIVSRGSMKEANRPVPFDRYRLHEVINRKALEPLSMIKTDRP